MAVALRALFSTIAPEESSIGLRWMIGQINATERAFVLGGMKQGAPPQVFNAVMGMAREVLNQRAFSKLESALA